MDIFLIIIGSLFMILGIAGSILPVLPGPSVSFLGLILIHLTTKIDFSFDLIPLTITKNPSYDN